MSKFRNCIKVMNIILFMLKRQILVGGVPSKIYPGYPGDIPDIFFDFFNKFFSENISGVSGVRVSKNLKENFEGLYLFSFYKK